MKTKTRTKQTGEVFTPRFLVQEMLDKLPPDQFTEASKTFLDNSCGNGQFLIEVIKKKVANGSSTIEQAIDTTYGVDLMVDNICDTMARIIFYKETGEDIFNDDGTPVDGLILDDYKDNHSFDSLHPGSGTQISYRVPYRTYNFLGKTIYIKKNKSKHWILEYVFCNNEFECRAVLKTAKIGSSRGWKNLPNIACADALNYHYNFDNSYPYKKDAIFNDGTLIL